MSSKKVSVDGFADAVMQELKNYNLAATADVKKAVTKAGTSVRKGISSGAPRKTGRYARSWTAKKTHETATSLEVTVYSPSRYMLAHLLEFGHAKRGGGRVRAIPHIAPAEAAGEEQLVRDIERALGGM